MGLTQVSTNGVKDGSLLNADINASAAIAGSKISPSFESDITISNLGPSLSLVDLNHDSDYKVKAQSGIFTIEDITNSNAVRLAIDSSGNVRVLTGDIRVGDDTDSNAGTQTISVGSVSSGSGGIGIFANPTNGNSFLQFGDGTASADQYRGFLNYQHASDSLIFGSAGSERMRIDSSGRLLLGTTTEGHASANEFTIASSATTGLTIRSGTSSEGNIYFSKGTSGSDEYKGIVAYLHNVNAMQFYTDATERIRIDSSGNVGIGTTSPSAKIHADNGGSGNVAFLKHASSGIAVTLKLQNNRATGSLAGEQISFLDDTGTQRGKITNTTATTTYHTSSDYRLKENEVPISDGIERVKQLKPYKFSWKHIPNKIVDGFFAHEVENLVEDCVDGTKDRVVTKDDHDKGDYLDKEIGTEIHQMMDHSKLVPLLVAAVQELITKVETLEAA